MQHLIFRLDTKLHLCRRDFYIRISLKLTLKPERFLIKSHPKLVSDISLEISLTLQKTFKHVLLLELQSVLEILLKFTGFLVLKSKSCTKHKKSKTKNMNFILSLSNDVFECRYQLCEAEFIR